MKKFLLGIFALSCVTLNAQTIPFCETFNPNPSGWTLSQGAKIDVYPNPGNACTNENGIITPGVGGNNPASVLTATITSPTAGAKVITSFDIWPFDANLACASRANQFLCATTCDIYVTPSTYNSTTVPTGGNLLASYTGYVLTNGGAYALVIQLPTGISTFKILFKFGAQSNNCNQPGTKYVLDNFCNSLSGCTGSGSCLPVANDDAFVLPTNNTTQTFKANVYGSDIAYVPPAGYETRSLLTGPGNNAVDDGFDFDPDNHPQAQMSWSLLNPGNTSTYGTLTFNANGTFQYVRNGIPAPSNTVVHFTYQIKDPTNQTDNATVYISIPANGGLPVKFLSFNAQQSSGKVALKWQTAQEINNKEFRVERRIANGGFKTIAAVPSKALSGNSGVVLDYAFDDADNLTGLGQVYYRIKQVDFDGHSDYSEIRSVRNNAKNLALTIYPNPGHQPKITIPDGTGIVDVSVSDMSGKEVQRWNATTLKSFQLTNLRPGMYNIRVNVKETGDVLIDKVMIQ